MRKLVLGLVLLAASGTAALAETITVTVVNHRPTGVRVWSPPGYACSLDREHMEVVTSSRTYTCDPTRGPEGVAHNFSLLSLASTRGSALCEVFWVSQPVDPRLPTGVAISQQVNSGGPKDHTTPGCSLQQTGPTAFEVTAGRATDWMGYEY